MADPSHSPVTLADIARRLDLSVGAVGMALRGTGTLSAKTRERVKAAADEMGYRPDPLLSALASRRFKGKHDAKGTPLVLLVGAQSRHSRQKYWDGLGAEALQFGYTLTQETVGTAAEYPKLLDRFYHRGVQGIILLATPWEEGCVELPWDRFALLALRQDTCALPLHGVRSGIFQKWIAMAERVEATGRTNIGQLVQVQSRAFSHREDLVRVGAAQAIRQVHDRAWPEPLVVPFSMQGQKLKQCLGRYLKRHRCDALLSTTSGALEVVRDLRYQVPKTVAVASGLVSPADAQQGISGMMDNAPLTCLQALRVIDQEIRHGTRGIPEEPVETVIPAAWHAGTTVAA